MNVGAVGAVGSGAAPVYAALSPYLNGVVRTSDAAAAAQVQAAAAATSAAATAAAVAARTQAAATLAAAPPFLNPAIAQIADQTALGQAVIAPVATTPNAQAAPAITANNATAAAATTLAEATNSPNAIDTATVPLVNPNTVAPPPPSATDSVAYGDSGLLVQSYGAVALLSGPLAFASVYGLPPTPAVPPVAPVAASPRVAPVDIAA